MKKTFYSFLTGLVFFVGIGFPATAQDAVNEAAVEIADSPIEAEYGVSTSIETDSGKSDEADSTWGHQLTDIDVEAYLTFSKAVTDTIGVYWGLYDWMNVTLNPDGTQSGLANEITGLAGITYDPSETFSLFFDGGIITAVTALPDGDNYMYGGFAFNLGFDVYAEEVPVGFSFAEYLNPMMAFHSADDWYIFNISDATFTYSFVDELSDKAAGGFFAGLYLENLVSFDGAAYFDDFVRVDFFTGFDVTLATGNDDIYPGFKAGLAYLYESGCETGSDREAWRNDLGPLLGLYGQCGAFNAYADFQPMLYTPNSNPYLRISLGMGFDF